MDTNYYGLKHDVVARQFSGDLTYITTMCIEDGYKPWAVYHAANPDTSKGHKEYMLLQVEGKQGRVIGRTAEQMEPWWKQDAIQCELCKDVVFSINRHDMHYCECGACFIDGGREYCRRTVTSTIEGSYHHLTKEFTANVPSPPHL